MTEIILYRKNLAYQVFATINLELNPSIFYFIFTIFYLVSNNN